MPTTPTGSPFFAPMEQNRRDMYNQVMSGGTGMDQLQNYAKYGAAGSLLNPSVAYNQWNDLYNQDPRINAANQRYDDAYAGLNKSATGFGDYANRFLNSDVGTLQAQAYGTGKYADPNNSYAAMYGRAQAQQAQGDIAKQAAMGARGGMTGADRRNAIMQSSNVGANMASQIAAARVQERQAAMQQYLQAKGMQAQVRGQGVEAMNALNTAAAGGQSMENQRFGGIGQQAGTTVSQQGNAFWPGPK